MGRPGGELSDVSVTKVTATDRSRALLTRLLGSAMARRAQAQWMSTGASEWLRLRLIAGQRDGQRIGWLIGARAASTVTAELHCTALSHLATSLMRKAPVQAMCRRTWIDSSGSEGEGQLQGAADRRAAAAAAVGQSAAGRAVDG